MTNQEKLEMLIKQHDSTKSIKVKKQLEKAIYRTKKKIREEKIGMKMKDNILFQMN